MTEQHRNRRSSIGLILTIAFVSMAFLPVLAAVVGSISQQAVRRPIRDMAASSVIFLDDYRLLINSTVELSRLLNSPDGLSGRDSLTVLKTSADTTLASVRELSADAGFVLQDSQISERLPDRYRELEIEARGILSNAEKIVGAEERLADSVLKIRAQAEAIVQLTRELGATLEDNAERQRLIDSLAKLRFDVLSLGLGVDEAAQATSALDLAAVETQFSATLRASIFQLSFLTENAGRPRFARELAELFRLSRGQDNPFRIAADILDLRAERTEVQKRFQDRSAELLDVANGLAIRSGAATSLSLAAADRALSVSFAAMMAAGVFSMVIGLAFLWRYVYRRLILRLRTLSKSTLRLNDTAAWIPLTMDGNDELADLQAALNKAHEGVVALEERDRSLERRTEELETLNEELDNFAYIASHDLRAPLRAIDSLASFIQEDLGDDIPEESARHIKLMRSRIARLEALLAGLLEYSRIGKQDPVWERVDLRSLIRRSAELVLQDGFELGMHGDFPHAQIATAPVEQLVRNLVDNAIKHHDKDSGRIDISGKLQGDEFILSIADDGPGIEPEYHDRIFGLFQTLKSRDTVEASGLGLAILRKTIEKLGGRIRVESNPAIARGTTVVAQWPVKLMPA